ncbi:Phosphoesterase PA-phosphatase related protein OS=Tsukamurella paurometabola (strain ATCC 8368 / DSM / CCUG 35730 / CIP 100753 / JCM 10117 / KCTC 9821 /NBRC 16120 / NCIMB 702349 / NCTC 13040) OX=521096 GN=Tpau_0831 PE=4 SV=1 [Tsukamurella paurometabola]|uniref:Phosphoesterase PA-phosphatase related protein n=1 Tax=Tsukamurella paurometabola (strain ATCC 8368 / DSM 20162 / CCUG 35730 / CIP 100753 / JCM 10117 / KCTC 9821 / NBRC 16120 / NCIMB 702349 / NCTC 13040) TaxID=521096 RepID=D5UTW3_TSUPD|nr:phosphatase PAP2 family protein [Tsukamurella paurometabola]ADG77467.1 phosphoesterase PA-phosphatase related protein [Tsukamurella paurometabola DSM 20162]SUP27236.1 PAP2 superfamily [Tsukamurella paurometabola]
MTDQWPNPVDSGVLDAVVAIRTDGLTAAVRVVTTFGNTVSLIAIATIGVLVLLRLRRYAWAAYCGATSLAGWGVMFVTKLAFGRERPAIPPRLIEIDSLSFPSGHALNSMVVLGCLAVAATALTGRRWPLLVAGAGSVAIGLSRVYLAAHWFTDVLAGWFIGAALVAAGLLVAQRMAPEIRSGRAVRRGPRAAPPAAGP